MPKWPYLLLPLALVIAAAPFLPSSDRASGGFGGRDGGPGKFAPDQRPPSAQPGASSSGASTSAAPTTR